MRSRVVNEANLQITTALRNLLIGMELATLIENGCFEAGGSLFDGGERIGTAIPFGCISVAKFQTRVRSQ